MYNVIPTNLYIVMYLGQAARPVVPGPLQLLPLYLVQDAILPAQVLITQTQEVVYHKRWLFGALINVELDDVMV